MKPSGPRAPTELERSTLDRARAHDPLALRAFVGRYERPVFALLSRMVGRGPLLEDLAQETFLRAFRALPSFDPEGSAKVSTWLLTIAMRLALDARKAKRLPMAAPERMNDVVEPGTPETERARKELGQRIAKAVDTLTDDHRAAFLLAELHGFSLKEVGEALGIPEATAKTRVYRARQEMRAQLENDHD